MEVIQRFSPKIQFLNFLAVRAGLAGYGPYIMSCSSHSLCIAVRRLTCRFTCVVITVLAKKKTDLSRNHDTVYPAGSRKI